MIAAHLYFYPRTDEPFPVELTSFTAGLYNNYIILKWSTATEINNFGFDVERNAEISGWQKIGFVPGSGNSNSTKNYSFTDENIPDVKVLYYRLKQIDNDGKFKYSNIAELKPGNLPHNFSLAQNFPNPFNPGTRIDFYTEKEEQVTLKIFNVLGTEVKTVINEIMPGGLHTVNINASDLVSGVYYYQLVSGNYNAAKKMILLR